MAYEGSTAANPNVPYVHIDAMFGPKDYRYISTHTQAEVAAAGFITDGKNLAMKIRDSVLVMSSTGFLVSHHVVTDVSSSGASLSPGLLISSAS